MVFSHLFCYYWVGRFRNYYFADKTIVQPLYAFSADRAHRGNRDAPSQNRTQSDACHEKRKCPLPNPPRFLKGMAGSFRNHADLCLQQKPIARISTRQSASALRSAARFLPYHGPRPRGNFLWSQFATNSRVLWRLPSLGRRSWLLPDYNA